MIKDITYINLQELVLPTYFPQKLTKPTQSRVKINTKIAHKKAKHSQTRPIDPSRKRMQIHKDLKYHNIGFVSNILSLLNIHLCINKTWH